MLGVLFLAAPATAAPVNATATISLRVGDVTFGALTIAGSGTVDVAGGVISVPAGLVGLGGTLVVPVTILSSVSALSLVGFGNQAGTFSVGGVTAQAPAEVCPGGVANAGGSGGLACNVGGGLGGVAGLTGTLNVVIVPGIVVIPLSLDGLQIGQGGSTNAPILVDAAAWTTGTALLNTGVNSVATTGFAGTSSFQLVSPLFAAACGNILPIFSTFTIQLVAAPEPAIGALIWLGLLGIVVLTRRK